MINSFLLWPFPSVHCMVKYLSWVALISQKKQQYSVLGKENCKTVPQTIFLPQKKHIE